jgi:hypothetical protein
VNSFVPPDLCRLQCFISGCEFDIFPHQKEHKTLVLEDPGGDTRDQQTQLRALFL